MSQTEEQPVQNQWREKIWVLVNYSSVNIKRVGMGEGPLLFSISHLG